MTEYSSLGELTLYDKTPHMGSVKTRYITKLSWPILRQFIFIHFQNKKIWTLDKARLKKCTFHFVDII